MSQNVESKTVELTSQSAPSTLSNNDEKNITNLVNKASALISKWTNKEAGDYKFPGKMQKNCKKEKYMI